VRQPPHAITAVTSAADITDAMDEPARKIMALPAVTIAGLAVKAKAAAFACSHFYRAERLRDADWDHQHVRTLIDAVLVMAGHPPISSPEAEAQPDTIDPALIVALRFLDASKAYDKASESGEDSSDAHATLRAARRALFHAEPATVGGVAALLTALANNDTDESPIKIMVNGDAADTVNDFIRRLAAVLCSEA
jgi:hypothetical protein